MSPSHPPIIAGRSRRSRPGVVGALLLAVAVANCGLDKLTGGDSAATAVTFAVSGDSVLTVGASRPFTVIPSAPVNFANVALAFEVSDTSLARVDSVRAQTAWITGRRNGALRVRFTARSPELPSGRVDSARARVRFGAIRIDPIDTIAGLGPLNNANQRTVVVRGTRADGSPAAGTPTVTATITSRDTLRLRPQAPGSATLVARDTGLVWVVADLDGALDSVRVPIRRRLTRIVADSLAFGALFTSRSAPVRLLDAGDSAIVGLPFRFIGLDTVRLQVDSTGPGASATAPRLRARVRDTSSYQVQTLVLTSSRARTRVQQVPAGIIVAAGAGQSARYGTDLPVAPRIVVRDSGQQGIGGLTVTFSVPNAGNGTITGGSATTNAAGEATVGGWRLGPTSGVDTLLVSVTGLPPFAVTATALAGPAAGVRFVRQPTGATRAARIAPGPQVAVVDSAGNVVAAATDTITVARVGAAGGALTGALSVAAAFGVAQFDSLVFADTATSARLVATRAAGGSDTSAVFTIGLPAASLVSTSSVSGYLGGTLLPALEFELLDFRNFRALGASDTVSLSLSTTAATLTGTLRRAAVGGRVRFDDLRLVGGANNTVVISATTAGGLSATLSVFIETGPPARLAFRDAPVSVAPGVTQFVNVIATDSGGNATNVSGINVTLRFGVNPSGATLSDTARALSFGLVQFQPSVSAAGTGFTMVASAPGLGNVTSAPFNVRAPGPAARIRWRTKAPASGFAGFGIAVPIELLDTAGVRSTLTRFPYAVSILSGPAGAVLTAPGDSIFTGGVASGAAVRVRTAGTYRFVVSAAGLAPDTSGPYTVGAGAGTRLRVLSQPTTTGVGSPIPPVQVALTDSLGNVSLNLATGAFVGNSLAITASATASGGAAAALGGTISAITRDGIATFGDLSIAAAGTGYRLQFASASVTSATSDSFSVRVPGTPVRLRFSALPATINGGSPINPAIRVAVVDSAGTTVSTRTDQITLSLTGAAGATLAGTTTVTAANGVAQFTGVTIPRADTGLRIVAQSSLPGIVADSTPRFRVNVGPVSRLRFLEVPATLIPMARMTPSPVVAATDSGGNVVTTASDSIGLTPFSPGPTFWSTFGRTGVALVNGVARFDSLLVSASPGQEVRLTPFSWRGVSYARRDTTAAVTATVGSAQRVRVEWNAGSRISAGTGYLLFGNVLDAGGNRVTTAAVPVTLGIIGPAGAIVGGSTTTTSVNGAWQLSPVVLTTPGQYRWVITSPALAADTSAPFVVMGPAMRPRIMQAPATGVRNGAMGPVRVILLDALGQGVRMAGARVSIALSGGGALAGQTTAVTSIGTGDTASTVTFTNLVPDAGGARRLVVTLSPGSGVAASPQPDSVPLAIATYGPAAALQFTTQPSTVLAGGTMGSSPVVAVLDSVGNVVTDSVARSISISLQQGVQPGLNTPTNGSLFGTLSATPAPGTGTATFANLSVNAPGSGYALVATANGVNAGLSASFNVVQASDAFALRFLPTTVPTSATAGGVLSGSGGTLAVEVVNSSNARVTSGTVPITLSVQGNAAPFAGTVTVAAVNGVATFPAATIQRAGGPYTLVATSPGLNAATSANAVPVEPAAAAALRVLDSLPTVVAGTTWPSLRVAIVDGFQNIVTSATSAVTLRGRQSFPGDSSYLTATTETALDVTAPVVVNAVSGIATFTGLRPRFAMQQNFNRFFFDATGLGSASTPRFVVLGGAPAAALIGTDSSFSARFANNQPLAAYLYVFDSLGNCASSAPPSVTLGVRRTNGTAPPAGIALSGSSTQTTTGCFTRLDGRAFTGVTAADSLQLTITAAGLTTLSGNRSFAVVPFGNPAQLSLRQGPSNTNRATNITPAVTVGVTDAFGNVVSNLTTGVNGLTGTITLTLPNATSVGGASTVLSGGGPVNLVNGLATFPGLQVNNPGTGYQLRAAVTAGTSVPGVTAAILSLLFNIL